MPEESGVKVLLINRALGCSSPPQLVQGWHGEQVGHSRFDPKHACHTLTISVEAYNKVAQSLSRASQMAMRLWEVHVVLPVAPPLAETEPPKMELIDLGPIGESDDVQHAPFFALRKIAKEEGVDITACDGCEAIRSAIRAHRAELVPA